MTVSLLFLADSLRVLPPIQPVRPLRVSAQYPSGLNLPKVGHAKEPYSTLKTMVMQWAQRWRPEVNCCEAGTGGWPWCQDQGTDYVIWNMVVYAKYSRVFPICLLRPHCHYPVIWSSSSLMPSWQEYEKELAKMKSAAREASGIKMD